jgi:hypothetical protein
MHGREGIGDDVRGLEVYFEPKGKFAAVHIETGRLEL